jgi:glycosyltransferase involved in cell wall biosynthesis
MRLIVVADRPPSIEGVPLEFRRWTLEREVAAFDEMSVGLMPLDDSQWARGKCAFKALQYMALALPAVVSPVGMNAEVIEDGRHGYHALDQDAWFEALDRLLSDVAHARALGAAGRRRVERDYSVSVTSKRLVSLLRELVPVSDAPS